MTCMPCYSDFMAQIADDDRCDHLTWCKRYGREIGLRMHGNIQIVFPGEMGAGGWVPAAAIAEILEINGKGSAITIGAGSDIAAGVTITCSDSHRRCIGLSDEIERKPITIGRNVFIGQNAIILGGCEIGDYSVIGAGVVLKNAKIPPHSRVRSPEPIIEPGFYAR